jgi:hypothetical protein
MEWNARHTPINADTRYGGKSRSLSALKLSLCGSLPCILQVFGNCGIYTPPSPDGGSCVCARGVQEFHFGARKAAVDLACVAAVTSASVPGRSGSCLKD